MFLSQPLLVYSNDCFKNPTIRHYTTNAHYLDLSCTYSRR